MNRWKFLFSGAALLVGFFGVLMVSSAGVRQRSDGCGPHPLIVLAAASRPFASSSTSLNEVLRAVRSDPDVWAEMQILLRRYDDCIRAGDGLHFKRAANNVPSWEKTIIIPSSPDFSSTQEFPVSNLPVL